MVKVIDPNIETYALQSAKWLNDLSICALDYRSLLKRLREKYVDRDPQNLRRIEESIATAILNEIKGDWPSEIFKSRTKFNIRSFVSNLCASIFIRYGKEIISAAYIKIHAAPDESIEMSLKSIYDETNERQDYFEYGILICLDYSEGNVLKQIQDYVRSEGRQKFAHNLLLIEPGRDMQRIKCSVSDDITTEVVRKFGTGKKSI